MDKNTYETAHELASRIFSEGFSHVQRGRNNWVFESEGRILTVPRHERVKNYATRVRATQFLASHGIPVAEVLEYSPESDTQPEYLVVRKVDGSNVDLAVLTPGERASVHQSAGEVLRAIHNLKRPGYGRLDDSLVGEDSSWLEFTDRYFREAMRRVGESPDLLDKYGEVLEKAYAEGRKGLVGFSNPSFLHADVHPGNLLFVNSKVSAVLDLDLVTSGDAPWDTGHYCHTFNTDRAGGVKAFRAGYGLSGDPDRERLYSLMIWAKKIGSQATQRPDALKETIPELERIIRGQE
jgi:aminoglycoside phosphotransferase (APT) family kinase protein